MTELTIDQQMAYIRKALEMGADVDVRFHNINDETEAIKVAYSFSKLSNVPFKEVSGGSFNWFKVDGPIPTTVFFNKEYMEEDIDLSGMESGDRIA